MRTVYFPQNVLLSYDDAGNATLTAGGVMVMIPKEVAAWVGRDLYQQWSGVSTVDGYPISRSRPA